MPPRATGLLAVAALGAVLLASGCTKAPILVPSNQFAPVEGTSSQASDMRAAILNGISTKGWKKIQDEPGRIAARIDYGQHWAEVDIPYDADGYSIEHRATSPGLKYDGATVHRRYNHWVRLLDQAIIRVLTGR